MSATVEGRSLLSSGQSVSFDVVLSVLTGTKVPQGPGSTGTCDGGSGVPGGLDYEFESVETEGTCFSDFARADQDELVVRIAQGEFGAFTFLTPSQPAQVWQVEFSGGYTGSINLNFGYDATLLPAGFDESGLAIYHFTGGSWVKLPGTVNTVAHSISVSTTTLGAFALGVDATTAFNIDASTAPANSGVITGAGSYAQGSSVSLGATPNAGYVFANWTEGATVASTSPNYTFTSAAPRDLVARFAALPKITVAPAATPGQIVFTWFDTPNWVLKESPNLATWTTSTRTITTTSGQNSVTVNTSEGSAFFRLSYQ